MSNHTSAFKLPDGVTYTLPQSAGVTALVIISLASFLAVLGLVCVIAISAFNTRRSVDEDLFVRSHIAAYFFCLLLCDGLQAIGSIMNSRWVLDKGITFGRFCIVQGVVKQVADVGIAMWNVVIALHTFALFVLEGKVPVLVHWGTLVSGWTIICAVVIYGPIATKNKNLGPFYSISRFWCWISPDFPNERIALDYLFMFTASATCFILYVLVFLHLQGYLVVKGWRPRFVFAGCHTPDFCSEDLPNGKLRNVSKKMLFFPVTYTILVMPITTVRFLEWTGHKVEFEGVIFSAAVFLLSGTIDVILFSATRRTILPPTSVAFRQAVGSRSDNGHGESSESPCSSDPCSVRSSVEEQQSDEKGAPMYRRNRSFESHGKSEENDVQPIPRENPGVTSRKSLESLFSVGASLHEVQLSAR